MPCGFDKRKREAFTKAAEEDFIIAMEQASDEKVMAEELTAHISKEFTTSFAHATFVQLFQELEAAQILPGYATATEGRLPEEAR